MIDLRPESAHAVAGRIDFRALIEARAAQNGDDLFLLAPDSETTISYRQLRDSARGVARALAEVAPTGPIGWLAGNGWPTVRVLLGALYGGRVAAPINPAAGDSQIEYIIGHSGCRAIFVDAQNRPRLEKIARECAVAPRVFDIDGIESGAQENDAELAAAPESDSPRERPALLIYTSGTTGRPKGVLHTHSSLLAGAANTVLAHRLRAADRALCSLPLCHINGLCVTVFAPLLAGGSVVMPDKFRADDFWRLIAERRCSWFSVVPTIVARLLDLPPRAPDPQTEPRAFSALRFGRSASAPLSPDSLRRFEERFRIPLIETMGLTETAAQILANPPPPAARKIGSAGIAFGNEVAVLDSDGREKKRGEIGEIAARGGNVMREYLRAPADTAAAFTVGGWFLSGDLGRMDEDGFVFVTGRRKELIIKGGENIAPREIDDALHRAPGVLEAAAFARACPVYGQRVEAAVVLARPDAHDEAELILLCAREVGKFKAPDKIHFLAELPKGPSGKIQRRLLAEALGG